MATPTARPAPQSALSELLAIARYHILGVAMAANLVFGWLMTGEVPWALALVVCVDWFLINFMNRVTDVAEDLKNGIAGTERVARNHRAYTIFAWGLMAASFAVTIPLWPELTPWRVAVQLIGLGYNYRIVPTFKGWSRFKEIYFFKNFGSSVIFVLTGFVYPIVAWHGPLQMSWGGIVTLALFFVPFEMTYEILYDLRDLEGDRAEGVPTYPVVHGALAACRIIDGLLVFSAAVLVAGLALRFIGVREGLMLAAPAIQLAFYRPRLKRGLTAHDCIVLTHLGTGLLLFYLAGNAVWLAAGMPVNLWPFGPPA